MTIRQQILKALADVPGSRPGVWMHVEIEPSGPPYPVHIFWFAHRLCVFVEEPESGPTATAFDQFLSDWAGFGAFVRIVTNQRQLDAALATLRHRYLKEIPCQKSSGSSSAPPTGSRTRNT